MTISLTATVQATAPLQVKLLVTATNTAPSAVPDNTLLDVRRVHADGSVHRVLTEAGPRLVGGSWVWLDVHAPYNQQVSYTVASANGRTAASAPVWVLSKRTWLLHPERADLAVAVDCVSTISDRTRSTRSARFQPIGGKALFLTDGARDGVKGSLTLRVATADVPKFDALVDDDTVILINTPGTAGWDLGWMWVQALDVSYGNKANLTSYPYRDVTIPFEEAADPDTDFEPSWSDADATLAFATDALMEAAFATDADLTTNTRL